VPSALPSPAFIRTPAQVRALRSPTRQELVDALASSGPASAAELAALLSRAPDALYFHLKALLKVGLIIEREPRRNGRHVAAIYDLPAHPMRLSYAKPVRQKDIAAVVTSALRLSLRDFQRGLQTGAVSEGPRRELWGGRVKGWVTARELARLNELLQEAHTILRAGRPGAGTTLMTVGFVLAPSGRTKSTRIRE
jgi:DNA-binding transcriptional ArsR family regulator